MIKKFPLSELQQSLSEILTRVRTGMSSMVTRKVGDSHTEDYVGIMPKEKAECLRQSRPWVGTEEELAQTLVGLLQFVELHGVCVPITVKGSNSDLEAVLLPNAQVQDLTPNYRKYHVRR